MTVRQVHRGCSDVQPHHHWRTPPPENNATTGEKPLSRLTTVRSSGMGSSLSLGFKDSLAFGLWECSSNVNCHQLAYNPCSFVWPQRCDLPV
ncbi:hypothetical protein KSP40_PGU011350 [Platanthera guangdongensis]|uniref:Uncharacterized protein n=1 Tax=Platanthera guangdongensis TaxID=2320717 RepID=A0ABR2MMF1_9ASPA